MVEASRDDSYDGNSRNRFNALSYGILRILSKEHPTQQPQIMRIWLDLQQHILDEAAALQKLELVRSQVCCPNHLFCVLAWMARENHPVEEGHASLPSSSGLAAMRINASSLTQDRFLPSIKR